MENKLREISPSLWRFLGVYFRPYTGWLAVAFSTSLFFALSTVFILSAFVPIQTELLKMDEAKSLPFGESVDEAETEEKAFTLFGTELSKANLYKMLERVWEGSKNRFSIGEEQVVWFLPLYLLLILLLRSLAAFINGYAFQKTGLGATTEIRNSLFERFMLQSARFHSEMPSGEVVSRVINDVSVMQMAISSRLVDFVKQAFNLVFLLWFLLSGFFKLTMICLVVMPVLVFAIVSFGRGLFSTSRQSQEKTAGLAEITNEATRGFRVIKAFGMEKFETDRFRAVTADHYRILLRGQVIAQISSPIVESLAALLCSGLLVYAGKTIRSGELTGAEFWAFLLALFALYDPIRKLNKVNIIFQQGLAAAERIHQVMLRPVEITDRKEAKSITELTESIRFERVGFAYGKDLVIRNIDFTITRGEVVAVVGEAGAGKSTLVNLLLRFFDPNEGRITIDGIDIRNLKRESLRRLTGLVSQDTILFNDTVRNNIAYGHVDTPLAQVMEAARAAYAHEFIQELPNGYDTMVGEAGGRLSGGQKQRVTIARALLKSPPILILDEATSQLDSESEAAVQRALGNLMADRTTLVIAHRLSTIRGADRIIAMKRGRIVESGPHNELMSIENGYYKRLYETQLRALEGSDE